jgi:hypothetical protein
MGVLSLPSGLAFATDDPSAIVPASLLCLLFGGLSAYSFSLIGKICQDTNSETFSEAWANTVSNSSSKVVPLCITAMCAMTPLAYGIMIGECLFRSRAHFLAN